MHWKGRILRAALLAAALAARAALAQQAQETLPLEPPEQPIPFSHRVHAKLGLACPDCHGMKDPGFAAGYPAEEKCMLCHQSVKADSPPITKLAQYAAAGKSIPWVKIYKVPTYVYFSHAFHHLDAKIGCEACHGSVAERDALGKEKHTSMASCMACHDQMGASNECNLCHDTM
jgi:hypothetical protein